MAGIDDIENPTLGTVLLQLSYVRGEHAKLDAKWQAEKDTAAQDELGDKMAALDPQISGLEDAARKLIATQTGVPWHLIEGANL